MINLLADIIEPSRRKMIAELLTGPKSVGELCGATGLRQPNVSNHLAKLRSAGVVRAQKLGRRVFYMIAEPEVAETLRTILGTVRSRPGPAPSPPDAAKRYARAAVGGDEGSCTRLVDTLVANEIDLLDLYENVLSAAMALVGNWYEMGAIDEGQEHLASATTERMLARIHRFTGQKPKSERTAILGCVAGNYHALGLRMASDYLAGLGWMTLFYGQDVPAHALVSACGIHRSDLLVVGCTRLEDREVAAETARTIVQEVRRDVRPLLAVGGKCVAEQDAELLQAGFDFTASSLTSFSEHVDARFC